MSERLRQCKHWVFDMDGTLTVDAHDFEYVRRQLGLASGSDILAELDKLPVKQAEAKHQWLQAYEAKVAARSQPSPGVLALLEHLLECNAKIAVVTRNTKALAEITLKAIDVYELLDDSLIYGRDCAPAKPDPYLLLQLSERWNVETTRMAMVGDFHFDLSFARAANVYSVLVNTDSNLWPALADVHYPNLQDLTQSLKALAK